MPAVQELDQSPISAMPELDRSCAPAVQELDQPSLSATQGLDRSPVSPMHESGLDSALQRQELVGGSSNRQEMAVSRRSGWS